MAARLIGLFAKRKSITNDLDTVIVRIDNRRACTCIKVVRALSRTMRQAFKIFLREVYAQHVRTEEKKVADHISRGKLEEAGRLSKTDSIMEWEEDKGVMNRWEEDIWKKQEVTLTN